MLCKKVHTISTLSIQLSHIQSPVITNPQLSTLRSMINAAITFLHLEAAELGTAAKSISVPTVRVVLNHVDYLMALLDLSYIFIWLSTLWQTHLTDFVFGASTQAFITYC